MPVNDLLMQCKTGGEITNYLHFMLISSDWIFAAAE
jgi:hypothetical protein